MEGKIIMKSCVVFLMLFGSCLACQGGTLIRTGVTAEEKAIILEEHNKLRATVAMGRVPGQPGAANMREMVWDNELAAKAQEWANQCTFKHDPHRTIARFTMGQNMGIIWSTAELGENEGSFPIRIQSWFNEVQKYAFGSNWSPKTGHYSQLVWGETNLVGCGFSYYKDASKFNKLYVCNYGPGGNVVGVDPYAVGTPACDSHGMKPSSKYQGLCLVNSGGLQNNVIKAFTYKSTTFNNKNSFTTQYQQQQQPQGGFVQTYFSKAQNDYTKKVQASSKNSYGYDWGYRK